MRFPNDIGVYGDTNYRGPCAREAVEQITVFRRLRDYYPELYAAAIHPRNEGKRHRTQVNREKAEGLNPGASDLIIPGSPCFVCEIKRRDHTKSAWQDGQEEYLRACNALGAFACLALGADSTMEAIEQWLIIQSEKHGMP